MRVETSPGCLQGESELQEVICKINRHILIELPYIYSHRKACNFFPNCTVIVARGPQLPNCQTQCHFSWLVVSPLRQKSTRSGNLVLAGILAFYAVKTASLSPPRPSRYLNFSSAHGCCTTGVLLVDVGARSLLAACTFK